LTLSIFQCLFEAFVGIRPSVALFRHYFSPRVEKGGFISELSPSACVVASGSTTSCCLWEYTGEYDTTRLVTEPNSHLHPRDLQDNVNYLLNRTDKLPPIPEWIPPLFDEDERRAHALPHMPDYDGFGINPAWVLPEQLAAGILQAPTDGGEDEKAEEDLLAEGGAVRAPPGPRRRWISNQRECGQH
jgi:hypothetical protein